MPIDFDFLPAPWLALLLDVSLKGSLVLGLAGALTLMLRHASAATRHLIWCLALVSLLVLPLLTASVPAWVVPLEAIQVGAVPKSVTAEPALTQESATTPAAPLAEPAFQAEAEKWASGKTSDALSVAMPPRVLNLADLLLIVWALGMLAIFGRLLIGRLGVWWLAHQGRPIADAAVRRMARVLARQLRVRRPVALLVSAQAPGPMTWGLRQPVLLLPTDTSAWPTERQRAVLLHELAHVQRWDWLTQTIAHVVRAVYWFNPLVWLATRRLIAEQEAACDDAVLAGGTPATQYAHHLLEIARSMRPMAWPLQTAPCMARWSSLEQRLRAILATRSRRALSRRTVSSAGVGMLLLIVPLAALHPQTAPPSVDPAEVIPMPAFPIMTEATPAVEMQPVMRFNASPAATLATEGVPATTPARADDPVTATQPVSEEAPALVIAHADSAVVRALMQALKDEHPDIRAQAAWTLGQIGSRTAVEALVKALSDPAVEVRKNVVWALGQIEDAGSVDGLSSALRDDEPEVREQAAWALGQIEDPRAVPALVVALKMDENAEVREHAAWALGQIGSPEAVQSLRAVLQNENAGLREQAAWALGQIESPMATDALIAMLRVDESADVREMAAWALGQIEDASAVDALSAAMNDDDLDVRRMAIWALGQIAD